MKKRDLLWRLFLLAAVFSIFLISLNTAHAADRTNFQCQPKNKLVDSSGKLVVGAFAISSALSSKDSLCPSGLLQWDQPIRAWPGRVLYFWFRMNGGPEYLETANKTESFKAYFYSIRSDGQIRSEKVINIGSITKGRAANEAKTFGGYFDWRLRGKRYGLSVPGKYRLRVQQGNRIICFNSPLSNRCSIDFEITQ